MPYNPGIAYRGDQNLAAGIAGFGQAFARLAEQQKQRSQEASILRKAFGLRYPERKNEFNAMGHEELKALGVAEAMQVADQERQSQEKLRTAQIGNLTADNERAAQFLALQKGQDARAQKTAVDREAFARLLGEPVPVNPLRELARVILPGVAQDYRGPMAQLQRAMREAPGGLPPEAVQTFVRYASEMADPNRQALAKAKVINAETGAANLHKKKDPTELTPYQKETLELRKTAMNDRRRESARRAAVEELKTHFDTSPEGKARHAALLERIDELSRIEEPAAAPGTAAAGANPKDPLGLFVR